METIPGRIGFISCRLTARDAVGREAVKWTQQLVQLGHDCFFFAGESDQPEARSVIVPEADPSHEDIAALHADLHNSETRSSKTSGQVQAIRFHLKQHLYQFIETFDINVLVVENVFAEPVNLPLALALSELIAETGMVTIAHHHTCRWGQAWGAADYHRAALPPTIPVIQHVVLHDHAARQLARFAGVAAVVIPAVMDFDQDPDTTAVADDALRRSLGLDSDQPFLLQPTPASPEQRTEISLELASRLVPGGALVVADDPSDPAAFYRIALAAQAETLGVTLASTGDSDGTLDLPSLYRHARLVCCPSTASGFGSAFIETVFYRRPVLVDRLEFRQIEPGRRGFEVVGFDAHPDPSTHDTARSLLGDSAQERALTGRNFELGRQYYHLDALARSLRVLLDRTTRKLA